MSRLVPDEPWWARETNLVVVGGAFSAESGLPTGIEVLKRAVHHSDERVPRLVAALETHLRDSLNLPLGPLTSREPREIFAALVAKDDPSRWIFGVRSGQTPPSPEVERARQQALAALFLLYHALLSDDYDGDVFTDADSYAWDEGVPAGAKELCTALAPKTCIVSTSHDDLLERALFAAGRVWAYGAPLHFHGPMVAHEYAPASATIKQFHREGNVFSILRPSFDDLPSSGDLLYWARGDWRPPMSLVRVDPREHLRQFGQLPVPLPWWASFGAEMTQLRPPAELPAEVVLCKLNGSLRWVKCLSCGRTYSVTFWGAHPTGEFLGGFEIPDDGDLAFSCWDSECPEGLHTKVVAPTGRWRLPHRILRKQWVTARRAAEGARAVVLIGAALDQYDAALQDLVVRAARSARILAFVDSDRTALERASHLFGRPARIFSSVSELADSGLLRQA